MNKAVAALLLGMSAPVWAGCNYPLNATQLEITQYPPTSGWLRPTVTGQSINVPLVAGSGLQSYAAFSEVGVLNLTDAYASGVAGGDVAVPTSGMTRVRMHIDSFPQQALSSSTGVAGMVVSLQTGNHTGNTPLPKDSLNFTVVLAMTGNAAAPLKIFLNGQAISGSDMQSVNEMLSAPMPLPADEIGFYIYVDPNDPTQARQLGLSIHVLNPTNDPNLPPTGDFEQRFKDNLNQGVSVPAGVATMAIALGAYQSNLTAADTAQLPMGATLVTDVCAGSSPSATLPNGKPFPGKGKALGLFK